MDVLEINELDIDLSNNLHFEEVRKSRALANALYETGLYKNDIKVAELFNDLMITYETQKDNFIE